MTAALLLLGYPRALFCHVVHVRLVHEGFENLAGEALVRLHLLMRFVVLASLWIADASPVEVG